MPSVGSVLKAHNQKSKTQDNSCGAACSAGVGAEDAVAFLTAPLFAKSTKRTCSTARDQEEQLSDLFVLIRHGERQDHADRAWKGNALLPLYDPPLSNAGRKQSFETALKYYTLRQEKKVEQRIHGTFTMFLVSPFHRCIETAAVMNIIAFEGKLPMYVDPLLSDWQQAKVFRNPPVLGGAYVLNSDAGVEDAHGDRLMFCPQREALRATLVPFLKTRVAEDSELIAEYGISAEVAASWAVIGEQWLDHHARLSVWTSAAATANTVDKIDAQQASTSRDSAAGEQTPHRKGGRSPMPPPVGDAERANLYKGCGVPHPESKADLVRRCEQVMATHYLQSTTTSSQSMVPRAIRQAAADERKTRLPKYFQMWTERPAEDRETAGPPALLPPTHIMAITHADIVSTLLEVCCPKYHDKGAGYSVAYCSITALQRHNNFYRIPPLEERQRAEASMNAHGTRQQRGNKGYPKKVNAMPSKNQLAAPMKTRAPPPLSVEWAVESVGSTDLLRTRIVIQYSK